MFSVNFCLLPFHNLLIPKYKWNAPPTPCTEPQSSHSVSTPRTARASEKSTTIILPRWRRLDSPANQDVGPPDEIWKTLDRISCLCRSGHFMLLCSSPVLFQLVIVCELPACGRKIRTPRTNPFLLAKFILNSNDSWVKWLKLTPVCMPGCQPAAQLE